MKRWSLAILLMFGLVFYRGQETYAQPQATANIQNFTFSPSPITLELGESILWTNLDQASHTVTSDQADVFNSGTLASQQTFAFTPTITGTIAYHCAFHPSMQGVIVVTAPMDQGIYIPSIMK